MKPHEPVNQNPDGSDMESPSILDIFHEKSTKVFVDDNQSTIFIGHDYPALTTLHVLDLLVFAIEQTELPAFRIAYKNNGLFVNIKTTIRLRYSINSVLNFYEKAAWRIGHYTLNPKIQFVLDTFCFLLQEDYFDTTYRINEKPYVEELIAKLNHAVETSKAFFNSPVCKKMENNFSRGARKNLESLKRYFRSLFSIKSRYLILRLDLEYRSSSQILQDAPAQVTYEEARQDKERFFALILRKFPEIKGYVWKLEHGGRRGYHYHTVFFVDSRTNPYDIRWARQLSEIWENEITEGRGFAYNCNAVKFKYKHCGIGMVDHCNEEAMKGLMRIASYLTKPDEWMRIRLDNNERSFGKGTIKPTTQKKRGRVRQKPSAKIWNI